MVYNPIFALPLILHISLILLCNLLPVFELFSAHKLLQQGAELRQLLQWDAF